MVNRIIRTVVSVAFSGAAPVAALILPSAAMAAPEGQSVLVRYADLDLTSSRGTQALQARIDRAARAVCGSADIRDLRAMSDVQHCRQVALSGAAPQVEVAIAQARSGRTYAANEVRISALR